MFNASSWAASPSASFNIFGTSPRPLSSRNRKASLFLSRKASRLFESTPSGKRRAIRSKRMLSATCKDLGLTGASGFNLISKGVPASPTRTNSKGESAWSNNDCPPIRASSSIAATGMPSASVTIFPLSPLFMVTKSGSSATASLRTLKL